MSFDVEMAKLFRNRDNVEYDEATIGTVISISPISVSLHNGHIILGPNECYICESLKGITGNITLNNIPEHGSVTTQFTITRSFNIGDKVMCVPVSNGNKYFIVDRVV